MDDGAGAGARILAERLSEKRCSKRSALAPFGVTRCEAELPAGDGLSSAPGQDFAGGTPIPSIVADDDSEELDAASPGLGKLE